MTQTDNRKLVRASNLTIRFYESDGWSEEDLKRHLKQGAVQSSRRFGDQPELAYFTFQVGSKIDIDSLMGEISSVQRRFKDQKRYTDRELVVRQIA
jgi:hypothetical protein